MDLFVSIHAPTRGATQNRFSLSGYTSVFQSTHPHGVRLQALATRDSTKEFQSTHPHGVRHNKQHNTNTPIMFQSTHPHGVRLPAYMLDQMTDMFQSTHPHGVRHGYNCCHRCTFLFQSTHPHGVRPAVCMTMPLTLMFQSTHPHRVRRHLPERCRTTIGVSIHAPTRGATPRSSPSTANSSSFNPRTHTGCDGVAVALHIIAGRVSIHAPTRGATI